MTRLAFGFWLAMAALASPAAANPARALQEGNRAMEALDYGRATAAFQRAVDDPSAVPSQLVDAYWALLRCHVVLGHESSARQAAAQLLQVDPGASLEGTNVPPRVTRFFEGFRRSFQAPEVDVAVSVRLPDRVRAGDELEVTARVVRGRRQVQSLRLAAQFGRHRYQVIELRRTAEGWSGTLDVPSDFRPASDPVRYYVEALAVSVTVLGGLGSADEPIVVPPRAQAREDPEDPDDRIVEGPHEEPGDGRRPGQGHDRSGPGITGQWWFWTGIGVVAAGAITAIVVASDEPVAARGGDAVFPLP